MTQRLALVRATGNEFLIASEAANLSMVERQLGNLDAPRRWIARRWRSSERIGDQFVTAVRHQRARRHRHGTRRVRAGGDARRRRRGDHGGAAHGLAAGRAAALRTHAGGPARGHGVGRNSIGHGAGGSRWMRATPSSWPSALAAERRAPVILPKIRDPRFITVRRGGTLQDDDHRLLAMWAADCAEHVLHHFEQARPKDDRPRRAIDLGRAWARGEIPWAEARTAAGHANAAARDLTRGSTACRVRCRPGRGGRPCGGPRARSRGLRGQGGAGGSARRRERGGWPLGVPVAARPTPRRDPRTRARRPAAAQRVVLVRVRLLTRLAGSRPARSAGTRARAILPHRSPVSRPFHLPSPQLRLSTNQGTAA